MIRNRFVLDGLLTLTLLVAAFLRFHELTGFSLSNDELSALARLQYQSIEEVITHGVYPDFHPAGVQVFLYYWTLLFGFGEWIVRFLFALMGVLSVYMIFRVGRMWFGEPTAILAAVSLAVLQYPILYSQIARPYSPGLLFSLCTLFYFNRIFFPLRDGKEKTSFTDYAGFVLSVSACMYTHYFSFIFAGLVCGAGLFFIRTKKIVPYLLCGAAIALLYLPHLNILFHQLGKGGVGGADGWLGPPGDDALSKYISYAFNESYQLRLLIFIVIIGTLILFRKSIRLNKFHLLSFLLFSLPFAIAYYYSIYKNPVFQFSILLFSFPCLLLMVFSFIPAKETGITLKIIFFGLLAAGLYSTLKEQKYYETAHFSEFRGIAKKTRIILDMYGDENVTRTISVFSPYYINYYTEKLNTPFRFDMYSIMTPEEINKFSALIDSSQKTYFLHAFSNVYDDPRFDMMIRSRYPWLVYRDSLFNSGIRMYSRDKSGTILNTEPVDRYAYGFENGEWKDELSSRDSLIKKEGNYSLHVNSNNEFGPTYEKPVRETVIEPGSVIELSASFYATSPVKDARFVISIESDGKSLLYIAEPIYKNAIENGKWMRHYIKADVPQLLNGNEMLKIYCWNPGKEEFWMDDLVVSIYSPR